MSEDVTENGKEKEAENQDELSSEESQKIEDNENQETVETDTQKEEVKAEDNFKEKFYYLAAEMDNMKKRFNREKESLIKFGNEKILSSLIDVLDSFDHALAAIENDEDEKVKNICQGIDMVRNQFLDALKKSGLEQVESIGKEFDPNFHEAMAQRPAEGKKDQEVILEYQKGYILNGRLLRAAKVVVVNNS